jgi:maltooligosyltrehalose synthase
MMSVQKQDMECAVYDTYVTKKDGRIMHFDVIVEANTPHEKAIEFGKEYLNSVDQGEQKMTQEECQFCHIQEAPPVVAKDIKDSGYYIQKMEGCP